jgi:hypothetical protein
MSSMTPVMKTRAVAGSSDQSNCRCCTEMVAAEGASKSISPNPPM